MLSYGQDGWMITPAGLRGVGNHAIAIYFQDAALAAGFVARWCRQRLPEIEEGAFVVRDDDPAPPRRVIAQDAIADAAGLSRFGRYGNTGRAALRGSAQYRDI